MPLALNMPGSQMLEYSGRTWPEEKSQAQKQSDGSSERPGHVQ